MSPEVVRVLEQWKAADDQASAAELVVRAAFLAGLNGVHSGPTLEQIERARDLRAVAIDRFAAVTIALANLRVAK